MAIRTQNMNNVPAFGDALPEGCYHFRVDKVEDDGGNLVLIYSKCQTEPFVGRSIRDRVELDNSIALSKLKSYYKACGYQPEGESHDPEQIQGGEFTAVIKHNQSKGNTYANIEPWSLRGIGEDPVQPLGPRS